MFNFTKSSPKSEQVCWIILWSHLSAPSGGGVPAMGWGLGLVLAPVPAAHHLKLIIFPQSDKINALPLLAFFTALFAGLTSCSSRVRRSAGHRRLRCHPRQVLWMRTAERCLLSLRMPSSCCRAPSLHTKLLIIGIGVDLGRGYLPEEDVPFAGGPVGADGGGRILLHHILLILLGEGEALQNGVAILQHFVFGAFEPLERRQQSVSGVESLESHPVRKTWRKNEI